MSPEERKQEVEEKVHPLTALKPGKSELTQRLLDFAIDVGLDSLKDLENCWWGDFKSLGVDESAWRRSRSSWGSAEAPFSLIHLASSCRRNVAGMGR